ncbi:hypothetical protein GBA52_018914 [Prunus armeniaca]|nr:hypothetical protein GBA52_018914 [Prunus armeniaca]
MALWVVYELTASLSPTAIQSISSLEDGQYGTDWISFFDTNSDFLSAKVVKKRKSLPYT